MCALVVEVARPRARSGLEDTRPSRVCVCVCGHARVSEGAPVLRPLVAEVGRTGTGHHRIGAGRRGALRIGPHLSVLGLRSMWSLRRRPTELSLLREPGRHPRGLRQSGRRSLGAIAVGDIASVALAGDAPVEIVTVESTGPAAVPEGAFWEPDAPQSHLARCREGRCHSDGRLGPGEHPGASCRARGLLNPPHECRSEGPTLRPRPAR